MEQIWVDKYRPKTFADIQGQSTFVDRVKAFLEAKNLPHLLFAGVPGTGKTTMAMVIARELYGENGMKGNYMELNASDDRGIDVIRNQIKEFAKLKSLADIPYKIICLDEADSLTKEAQQALRRTMERYSASCRFILACNELSKIIDPIQSRCVLFKFKALPKEALLSLLNKIEKEEGLTFNNESKEFLLEMAKGDLRRLVNTLQAAASISKTVTTKQVLEVLDFVNPKEVEEMLSFAIKGDFFGARDQMIKLRTLRGLSALEILKEIYRNVLEMDIDPKTKVKFVDRIATVEFRLVEGSDEELQLEALLAMMSMIP
ncbi:replication factor C small subunit [Candidatus Woesearchaeota archaeon]|nr:replication factor C small subunit [Nanoarchaeota archaeon]MCB9370357.1 replication factor C small subunit [Candidatus Woesearchaeota archaeon]USN44878.1 MAG: replication factor C small subunit [Candidatus Woesearchaeota archaeon]